MNTPPSLRVNLAPRYTEVAADSAPAPKTLQRIDAAIKDVWREFAAIFSRADDLDYRISYGTRAPWSVIVRRWLRGIHAKPAEAYAKIARICDELKWQMRCAAFGSSAKPLRETLVAEERREMPAELAESLVANSGTFRIEELRALVSSTEEHMDAQAEVVLAARAEIARMEAARR